DMRVCLVLVIFENVNDRQLPAGGHVHGFEKTSLFRGSIPEEAVHHLPGVLDLRRESRARGMRDCGGDNSRCPGKVVGWIGQMHGAAEAFAEPILASV